MTTGEVEARAQGNKLWIEGYAAVFNRRSQNLGGFVEQVKPPAFNKTVREADVRALWNHDPSLVLGRSRAGTLEMSIDDKGLYYRALAPNTTYAKNLLELLERRDITQSSFTFFKVNDEWDLTEDGFPERSLVEVGLVDVSPVTFPAYEDATSGLARRAAFDSLAKRCDLDICFLADEADDEVIKRAIQKLKEPDGSTTRDGGTPETRESTPEHEESRNVPSGREKAQAELAKLREEFPDLF